MRDVIAVLLTVVGLGAGILVTIELLAVGGARARRRELRRWLAAQKTGYPRAH